MKNLVLSMMFVVSSVFSTFALANENVVLINSFKVPEHQLGEAIKMWEKARDYLQQQPGYISTELHQSLSSDAQYRLINVAQWRTVEEYTKATQSMRANAGLPRIEGVKPSPALYHVIRRD